MYKSGIQLAFRALCVLTACLVAIEPAFAHHPMGGAVPATLWQGLLSGFGHPVIELDHLAFLVGAAAAVAMCRVSPQQAMRWLAGYAIAGAMGTALQAPRIDVPWAELAVVASLAAISLSLWLQRVPGFYITAVMAGAAGLVHGYAYGEAVIGAEATPLVAYLAGIALVQTALLVLVWMTLRQFLSIKPSGLKKFSRALGVLVAIVALWSGAGLLA